MLILKKVVYLLFLSFYTFGFSQEISGVIFNDKSGEPLVGASIYFNNTTLGTSTNLNGAFTLEYKEAIRTPLIISFMGFETLIINDFSRLYNLKFYLKESPNVLKEVTLNPKKDWPRALKLKEFRRNYLGETENGLASKILNEEDLILRFNKKEKQLTAVANVPILIKNANLAYVIKVNLRHFEVNYSYVSINKKILNIKYVYFFGNNFYKPLDENSTKIILKKRTETYLGSPLHFMRSMASEELEREKYKIYKGNHLVNPKKYITVTAIDNLNNVKVVFKDRLNILFEGDEQSFIKIKVPEFYIDNFGNYSPTDAITFGGKLGEKRMGDSLPIDFLMIKNKN
ncbi:carboxypeptidase-like regulatory domain-containing protein [Flavobacteriaceae bacterium AH-315-O20]|nr:carboxypeptidase-like regulatory domain-containing protein [Flavobacteriaceae bacterium AH-315-O20]